MAQGLELSLISEAVARYDSFVHALSLEFIRTQVLFISGVVLICQKSKF